MSRPYTLCPKTNVRLPVVDGERFLIGDYSSTHAILTLLSNATMNSNLAPVDNACKWQFCVENWAKPLAIATWLLMTGYKISSSPYPTSPTHYDVPRNHNTCFANTQTNDRQTQSSVISVTVRTVEQKRT